MRIVGLAAAIGLVTGCLALPDLGGDYELWADTGWGDYDGYSSWPDSEQGRMVAEAEAWGSIEGSGLSPDGQVSHVGMGSLVCGFETRSGNMGYDTSSGGESSVEDTTEQDGNVIVMARTRRGVSFYEGSFSRLDPQGSVDLADVSAAAFGPDGHAFALHGAGDCSLVELEDRRASSTFDLSSSACQLSSLDGNAEAMFVAAGDAVVRISDGEAVEMGVDAQSVSVDSAVLYAASGEMVRAIDAGSGDELWSVEIQGNVLDVAAVDGDGVLVLTAYGATRELIWLDGETGEVSDSMEVTGLTFAVDVSEDGSTMQLETASSVAFFSLQ